METTPTHVAADDWAALTTSDLLPRFARLMDADGIERVPAAALSALAATARERRVSEVLIGVLVDPTEPSVARERAFVKIAAKVIVPVVRERVVCRSTRPTADAFSGWNRSINSPSPVFHAPVSTPR